MIRLNDDNKTVIDETKITCYAIPQYFDGPHRLGFLMGNQPAEICVEYSDPRVKDDDIQLLDQIVKVKDIKELTDAPKAGKDDKYITWEDLKKLARRVIVHLPNGDSSSIYYDEENDVVHFVSPYGDMYAGSVYEEELFNSLKLRKVE